MLELPQTHLAAWIHSRMLTAAGILALTVLVVEARPGSDKTYSTAPALARLTRSSVSATKRRLAYLARMGAIKQIQRGNRYRASGWRILPPPPAF